MEMEMERFIKIICDTKEGLTQGKSQCVKYFLGYTVYVWKLIKKRGTVRYLTAKT